MTATRTLTDLPPTTVPGPAGGPLLDRFTDALRPRWAGPQLAAAFGGPSWCHVLDAKLEPGVSAMVLYAHGGRLVRGDLVDDAGQRLRGSTSAGPGLHVHRFPDDPDLPRLPLVMDADLLARELAGRLPGTSTRHTAVRCRISLLRYRPGKRATVRVAVAGTAERFVAKAYHSPAKAAAVAAEAVALARVGAARGATLRLAPTVAHLPELSLVVQRQVAGTPLELLVCTARGPAREAPRAVVLAARALAELHEVAGVTDRRRSVDRELDRFDLRTTRIGSVDPGVGLHLGRLADRLAAVQRQLPAARTGLVHGDCKPSQFLVAAPEVYLMDLDHLGVSDQAADVGTFLASLRQLGIRHARSRHRDGLPEELYVELGELFLAAYLDARGRRVDVARIRWHEAVALERKALRTFARAPRSPIVLALATEAHACLTRLTEEVA
jgi:hypothetical protein